MQAKLEIIICLFALDISFHAVVVFGLGTFHLLSTEGTRGLYQ